MDSHEIHGNTWKYMEIHGNSWKYMEIHGNSWKFMEIRMNDDDDALVSGISKKAAQPPPPECVGVCVGVQVYEAVSCLASKFIAKAERALCLALFSQTLLREAPDHLK